MFQTDNTVPGLSEARAVQAEIKRLGIQDVELFFDAPIAMWCVVQVRKTNTGIVTMDNLSGSETEPYLLFYCKNETGAYRAPGARDVQNVVAIVRESTHWFEKGAEALADEADSRDEEKKLKKESLIKERFQPHLKALKKAVRTELG